MAKVKGLKKILLLILAGILTLAVAGGCFIGGWFVREYFFENVGVSVSEKVYVLNSVEEPIWIDGMSETAKEEIYGIILSSGYTGSDEGLMSYYMDVYAKKLESVTFNKDGTCTLKLSSDVNTKFLKQKAVIEGKWKQKKANKSIVEFTYKVGDKEETITFEFKAGKLCFNIFEHDKLGVPFKLYISLTEQAK